MAENTALDTTHDDNLGDEALDRVDGQKLFTQGGTRPSRLDRP
jgi:hypothetical protein